MALPPVAPRQQPRDNWSIREKLALATSVERTRDQNWVSVSRQIKPFAEPDRPPDWFSLKNCALQYGSLLENVEKTKRKRGEEIDTPGSIIVKNLCQQRIAELEEDVKTFKEKYSELRKKMEQLDSGEMDGQVDEIIDQINKEADDKRKAQEEHQKWLKEREVYTNLEAERQRQLKLQISVMKAKKAIRTVSDASDSMQSDDSNVHLAPESPLLPPPQSSLLTSLLRSPTNSPSQSPRTTHGTTIPLPFNAQRSMSSDSQHSGGVTPVASSTPTQLPTLSRLLESPLVPGAGSPSGRQEPVPPKDNHPVEMGVASAADEPIADAPLKKTLSTIEDVSKELQQPQEGIIPLDPSIAEAVEAIPAADVRDENIISVIEELREDMDRKEQEEQRKQMLALQAAEDANVPQVGGAEAASAPDENTVMPLDQIKLEPTVEETPAVTPPCDPTPEAASTTQDVTPTVAVKEEDVISVPHEDQTVTMQTEVPEPKNEVDEIADTKDGVLKESADAVPSNPTENMSPPPAATPAKAVNPPKPEISNNDNTAQKPPLQKGPASTKAAKKVSLSTKAGGQTIQSQTPLAEEDVKAGRTEEGNGGSINPDESSAQDSQETESRAGSAESTADDREEQSDGPRVKNESEDEMIEEEVSEEDAANDAVDEEDREVGEDEEPAEQDEDYEDGESGSKTPELNLTLKEENVASSDDGRDNEKNHKIWKKSALLVWRTAANHNSANVFMNPVTEEMAPGYEDIVYRPMDLMTIRKNIENGVIKTTMELFRDMLLMFQNAIMYNSADHDVYNKAIKMQEDVVKQIEELMANESAERAGGSAATQSESLKRPARHRQSDIGTDLPPAKKARRSTGTSLK